MAGTGGDPGESSCPPPDRITVQVKLGGRTISLALSSEASVKELKSFLQPLTDVIPRGQKLIFKGKVLKDTDSLSALNISNGSKIMMIASEGLHQGGGPIRKDTSSIQRKTAKTMQTRIGSTPFATSGREDRWKMTGVVALSKCELEVVPDAVWACGPSVRMLDLSNNFIEELPANIGLLSSINKLLLSSNKLSGEQINWDGLMQLKTLKVLSLDHNQLISLPRSFGALSSLTQLNLSNNKLTSLPEELGFLNKLEVLIAENNRLSCLPLAIGNCISLIEVDFSSNLLEELPSTFGNLRNLKALHVSNNGLKTLPSALFKSCMQLTTLNLHGTEITNDILRQLDGWEAFNERRMKKHQKQLDFHVGCSDGFDEGADKDNRS